MSDVNDIPADDTEGHIRDAEGRSGRQADNEAADDTEGHIRDAEGRSGRQAGDEDDTEGHGSGGGR
jgi:hypothetical protein